MIDTILIDLDGTLLPMDTDEFTRVYFTELVKKMVPLGYDKDAVITAVYAGTSAMIKNDGSRTNRERFWDVFAEHLGENVRDTEDMFQNFYANEFNAAKSVMQPSDAPQRLIELVRERGYSLVLATNPLFPRVAIRTRLDWIGVEPEAFDLVTSYESSRYCKPNPEYFRALLERLGKTPEQCLMIGNNVEEDMCARSLGVSVFLLTDFLENKKGADFSAFPHGDMPQLMEYIRAL